MFYKKSMLASAFVGITLAGCAYDPQAVTAPMEPVQLMDGSIQQTVMAAVYDKYCTGPTVVQLVTYHAPRGAALKPVADGTVGGDGQCVALINAAGSVLGFALSGGTNITANAISVSQAVAVSGTVGT